MKIIVTPEEQKQLSQTLANIFDIEYVEQEYQSQVIDFDYKSHPAINPFFGKLHTENTKKHISEMQSTKVGELNQFYGKKHRPEVIENNRKKNIEILTKLRGKKVGQYDLNGNLISIHESIRSAARSVNLKCYNEISKCCRGIKENYCGYIWKYT